MEIEGRKKEPLSIEGDEDEEYRGIRMEKVTLMVINKTNIPNNRGGRKDRRKKIQQNVSTVYLLRQAE